MNKTNNKLITNLLLKTPEGWLYMAGSALCIIYGLLFRLAPSTIPQPRNLIQGITMGFLLMPLLLFVVFIKFSQQNHHSSFLTTIAISVTIMLPFYIVYIK